MFSVLRVVLIVLVVILGGAAAWWRASRYVDRAEPENPEPHVQQWHESMRELDEAVQKKEAPPPPQRD
jgi:cytoskeletal protein RodZ